MGRKKRTNLGKQYVDKLFSEQNGDVSISQLGAVIADNKQSKTVLIRWMMRKSGITLERLARYLGCMPQSLRNKMVRDSFSIDDLVICAHACNCSIQIRNNAESDGNNTLVINPYDFFRSSETETSVLERLEMLDKEDYKEKEKEYLVLKEELERMRAEYGFE